MTEPEQDRSSAMPILIALGVGLLVLGGFGVSVLVNGKEMTPDLLVAKAAVGQNDALQRENYADFQKYTCTAEQRTESEVLGRQNQSKNAKGARFVDDVAGVSITGDKATAMVTYHFEKAADDKLKLQVSFLNQDDDWKVCSPTP
jgi:hypothetical protein